MAKSKGTAKRVQKPVEEKPFEDGLVTVPALTGFLHTQIKAIGNACEKVAKDKCGIENAVEHCQHYLDGASQMASEIMGMMPPAKASDLIIYVKAYVDDLKKNAPRIAKETGTKPELVGSYINGAEKVADILINALKTAPRTDEPAEIQPKTIYKAADENGRERGTREVN